MPYSLVSLAILLGVLPIFSAEQTPDAALKIAARQYFEKVPQTSFRHGLSYSDALDTQKRYVPLLAARLGEPVGFKAGLVTPGGQRRFGIDHPVRGVLLQKMLLSNGAKVPAQYGTSPVLEADLVVRVKDEGLNDAKTIHEAARYLSEVIAFIELADTTLATNPPIDGGALVASNVGARLGVLGEARKISEAEQFVSSFGKMQIVLKKDGKELSRVSADGILGHPLNAVLWLVKDMNARGERLHAGQVLSLGSPSPQVSPAPGEQYTLLYEGLPGGDLHASVSIE